jgi:hypothetical protein
MPAASIADPITIFDGFEGSTLNAAWVSTGPGSAFLTTAAAFDGTQALELQSVASFPWSVELKYSLGSEQVGSVSIYMQRPACCMFSAAALDIWDQGITVADIQENADGSWAARVLPSFDNVTTNFTSPTPNGWHLLEMDVDAAGLTFKFDGSTIATSALVTHFDAVNLEDWAGPGGVAFYDDFRANTSPATPEPFTAWYVLPALAGAFLRRRIGSKRLRNGAAGGRA